MKARTFWQQAKAEIIDTTHLWESKEAGLDVLNTKSLDNDGDLSDFTDVSKNDYFDINGKYLGSDAADTQIKIIESYDEKVKLEKQKSKRYGLTKLSSLTHGKIANYYLKQVKGRLLVGFREEKVHLKVISAKGMKNTASEYMEIGRLDGEEPVPLRRDYAYSYGSHLGIRIALNQDGSLIREEMDNINYYKSILIHEAFHFLVDFYKKEGTYFNYPRDPVTAGWRHLNVYWVQTFSPEFQLITDTDILTKHYVSIYRLWRNTAFLSQNKKDIKYYYDTYVLKMISKEYQQKLGIKSLTL